MTFWGSAANLLATVQYIENVGAKFVSFKENFDTKMPAGKFQMAMMVAIVEFERAVILERQREGIAIAKRKENIKEIRISNIEEYYDKYMKRQKTKISIAAELGISRTTLNKLFDELKIPAGQDEKI